MPNRDKSGIILFIVIGVIMVVAILSTIILRVVSNHSRLTHHQVSRIQAQYAAKAGVLYALDKLRRNDDPGNWPDSGTIVKSMCQKVAAADLECDCSSPIIEPGLPNSVKCVKITVGLPDSGVVPGTRKVSATAAYTYTP